MANYPSSQNTDANLYVGVNNLSTVLTDNPLSAGAVTVNVSDASNFPTVGIITIDLEAIHYTGTTGTSFTGCTRGFDGTTGASHAVNATVFHDIPAAHHNVLKDEIKATTDDLRDGFTGDLDDSVAPAATAVDNKQRLDHLVTQLKNLSGAADWKTAPADTLAGLSTELVAIQSDLDDAVTPVASAADLNIRLNHIATQLKNLSGESDWKTTPVSTSSLSNNIINVIVNPSMEIWQKATSFTNPANGDLTADRWEVGKSGSVLPTVDISQETGAANIDRGTQSLKIDITATGTGSVFFMQQRIEDFEKYKNRTVTMTARIKTSLSGVKLQLTDGITGTDSSDHSGGGAFETLTITKFISNTATILFVRVGLVSDVPVTGTGVIYVDSVTCVLGDVPINFIPTPIEMDLARAQRHFEKRDTVIFDAVGRDDGTNYRLVVPVHYKVTKSNTPTITLTINKVAEEGADVDQQASYTEDVLNSTIEGFNARATKAIAGTKLSSFQFDWEAEV